ncbi:unnamed protein product [Lactuca saligna]|uniref:Uncharacterized protein n=1 Tax=Lactuca saligna TaxID=75948 RepID=A0AA36EKA3_LACSI|nr:unnamed protein product [Lactuca saligna]
MTLGDDDDDDVVSEDTPLNSLGDKPPPPPTPSSSNSPTPSHPPPHTPSLPPGSLPRTDDAKKGENSQRSNDQQMIPEGTQIDIDFDNEQINTRKRKAFFLGGANDAKVESSFATGDSSSPPLCKKSKLTGDLNDLTKEWCKIPVMSIEFTSGSGSGSRANGQDRSGLTIDQIWEMITVEVL